ncbi:hypothetical protein BJ508DRAFT_195184, partial [Ascobolus immersus RN42]
PRSGRPLKFSERIRRWIMTSIRQYRFTYISEIQAACPETISRSTIRRYIKDAGLDSRISRKKPFLTAAQRKTRLYWCTKYTKGWTQGEWDRVVWTDECSFEVGKNAGRLRCWRKPDEAFNPDCLRPTFKSGRSSLMVWGCIIKGRKSPLVFLEKPEGATRNSVTAQRYIDEVLRPVLIPFWTEMCEERGWAEVVEDNCRIHTAKISKAFRAQWGLESMLWPAASPDLNPIENVWALLKLKVAQLNPRPRSVPELKIALTRIWDELDPSTFDPYIDSMAKRVMLCVANKGGHTKY